jgi:hypothetical protein
MQECQRFGADPQHFAFHQHRISLTFKCPIASQWLGWTTPLKVFIAFFIATLDGICMAMVP